jgi:REP element-mobilizing transposase RayT
MPYWRLFYHIIWGTKQREPLIQFDFEASLYNVIAAKTTSSGAIVHAVGGIEDHVHLVASVPPKISLSQFIGQVKGNSSHFVTHELNIPFAWQSEYGVVSFGGQNLDMVVKYVKNQRQHHAARTTIRSLELTNPTEGEDAFT